MFVVTAQSYRLYKAQLWASIPSNLGKYSFHTFVKKYKEYLRMQYTGKVTWGYLDSEVTLTANCNIAMAHITLISTTPKRIAVNCYCLSLFMKQCKTGIAKYYTDSFMFSGL